MYINSYVNGDSTLNLVGCKFSGNSADYGIDDIYSSGGTVNIDGCPPGFSGAAGAALHAFTPNGVGGINGEEKSYSCDACVR